MYAILGSGTPLDRLVDQRGRPGHVRKALGRVGDDQLVRAVAVGEEIKDPLFLHKSAREVEICLAVLNAIVAVEISALELIGNIQARENLLQDVGYCELLKDPALSLACE